MDSSSQQAAVIREGDPSQSLPANTDIKVDTDEPVNANNENCKKSAKVSDKKTKHSAKKDGGGNTKKRLKRKSRKSRGKDESSSGSSSESKDENTDTSTSEGEDTEAEVVLPRRRAAKKKLDAQKLKLQASKKASPPPHKLQPVAESESDLSFSDSDSSSSDEDEKKKDAHPYLMAASGKAFNNSDLNRYIGYLLAKGLQHNVPLTQGPPPNQPPPPPALPSHHSINTGAVYCPTYHSINGINGGLDGGYNPGLNNGLSALNYAQADRGQPSRYAVPGGLNSLLDAANNRIGNDALRASQAQRPAGSHDKKHVGDSAGQGEMKLKKFDYKRVDQVWDRLTHNFRLQDTAEPSGETKYDDFCFHVRRTFDWEGKYKTTVVDIKSKVLRECLQDVIGNIKGVSLVDETPKLDPNILFLYLKDLRRYAKKLKKQIAKPPGPNKQARKKEAKRLEEKRQCLKALVKYIDKDYDQVKKSLYPMLEHGLITFDLLWALWKPDTLVYTTTYGSHDEPRAFKVVTAEKHYHVSKGEVYYVEGKYFEYDGKQFGHGNLIQGKLSLAPSRDHILLFSQNSRSLLRCFDCLVARIEDFHGAKKITSLDCYPLKYHKNEERLRKELIERGKKFTTLGGVHYKSHHGMAYFKKKKSIVKVNVNGRVMVDPAIHRRINPNYPISIVRPKEHDIVTDDENSSEEDDGNCNSDDYRAVQMMDMEDGEEKVNYVTKALKDFKAQNRLVRMPKEDADELDKERLARVESRNDAELESSGDDYEDGKPSKAKTVPEFTDEEYLIASPVVLGFSFGEKLWLEFTVSGIKEISWSEKAYESLVLEPKTKETVKALVESHKYHAASSIDDVIQGKGKGLVAVLHGPPGTGKTLTAEGISELLKCPLYMVSAGELGTDSRILEAELQRILDICHAWGAILLLDEADVFLEKRTMHDLHRNALVSIFLRQLEYFQGILFLTTNRVETFDDAFQSRIHIALRYDSLDLRAKKTIFRMFVERARAQQKVEDGDIVFTDDDYDSLARHELNGRQIKNTIIRAQALAVNMGEPLSMTHVRQILDVQVSFDRDLKGGTGYQEAMRSYF